jgi:dienelactone hydrolase
LIGVIFLASGFSSALTLSDVGLKEGDAISATSDPDIYIVNEFGYKRLFVSPQIFNFYSNLGWDKVKHISPATRDAFGTSGLFRNCETNDSKVYALDVINEDTANLRWINTSSAQAVADDPNFFKKVFCINSKEFSIYGTGQQYSSVLQVPAYGRNVVAQIPIGLTPSPTATFFPTPTSSVTPIFVAAATSVPTLPISSMYVPHLRTDQRHYAGGHQPLVITLAGTREDGLDGPSSAIGEQLAREIGAVTASIDLPGHGADSTNRGTVNELGGLAQWAQRINNGEDVIGEFIIELRSLINALTPPRSNWVDPHKIVLVGVSRGAFLALQAAAAGLGTQVVAIAPVTSLGALSEFQSPVSLVNNPYVLESRLAVSAAWGASNVPTYIVAGNIDPRVDTEETINFWRAMTKFGPPNKLELHLVPALNHTLLDTDLRYKEAATWVERQWK